MAQIEHPPKSSIGVSLKCSILSIFRLAVINIKIPTNQRKSPNSTAGPLILLLVSTRTASLTKPFGTKKTNAVRQVKKLMNYYFLPSSFYAYFKQLSSLLWSITFYERPYLYLGLSVSPLAIRFSRVLEVHLR